MSFALVCDTCNRSALFVRSQYGDADPPDGWELRIPTMGPDAWAPACAGYPSALARHRCPGCAAEAAKALAAKTQADDVRALLAKGFDELRESMRRELLEGFVATGLVYPRDPPAPPDCCASGTCRANEPPEEP